MKIKRETVTPKFRERLNQLMQEEGLSQAKLGFEISVAQSTVGTWTSGKRNPSEEQLDALCDFFGCNKDWLRGLAVSRERELKRNSSGCMDLTAYQAMKNLEKKEEKVKMRDFKRGEIYCYVTPNGSERYALVVSNNDRADEKTVGIILLSEHEYGVPVVCRTMMYANADRVTYGYVDNFGGFVRTATDEEMQAVEKAMMKSFGLESAPADEDANELRKKLFAALTELNRVEDKCEELEEKLKIAEERNKFLESQPVFTPDPEEVVKLKAQVEMLERQNERLLDRLIG